MAKLRFAADGDRKRLCGRWQPLPPPFTERGRSADFVFDRTADGLSVVKCLTVVDDATTEAVVIVPATRGLAGCR